MTSEGRNSWICNGLLRSGANSRFRTSYGRAGNGRDVGSSNQFESDQIEAPFWKEEENQGNSEELGMRKRNQNDSVSPGSAKTSSNRRNDLERLESQLIGFHENPLRDESKYSIKIAQILKEIDDQTESLSYPQRNSVISKTSKSYRGFLPEKPVSSSSNSTYQGRQLTPERYGMARNPRYFSPLRK